MQIYANLWYLICMNGKTSIMYGTFMKNYVKSKQNWWDLINGGGGGGGGAWIWTPNIFYLEKVLWIKPLADFRPCPATTGVFIATFKSSKQRFETEFRKFVAHDKHQGVLIRV